MVIGCLIQMKKSLFCQLDILNTMFTFMSMQLLIILFDTRTVQKETVMIMNAGSSLKVSKS